MTTAVIFPGLNTIMRRKDRERYLDLTEVKNRLEQAESLLQREFGLTVVFHQHRTLPVEHLYSPERIGIAAIMASAIQVGVMDRLHKLMPRPEWAMGCSLGDVARSISAGACEFDSLIAETYRFSRATKHIDSVGGNFGIRATRNNSFIQDDHNWFDQHEIDVSQFTPRFLTASCRYEDMPALERYAAARKWKLTRVIFNYPVHSRHIRPVVEHDKEFLRDFAVTSPSIRLFSSVLCEPLDSPEAILQETKFSTWSNINWEKAITRLNTDYGVTEFINVGPCRSLSIMMREIPVNATIRDAIQILK